MAAISRNNVKPRCFEAGGIFMVNDGTDDITVINMEPGTLEVEPGGREQREYDDRMSPQAPLLGRKQLTMIRARAKVADQAEAKNLQTLSVAEGATGLVKEYTVTIKTPEYFGASTGTSHVYTSCRFVKPVKITTGLQFDIYEFEIASRDQYGTVATY